MPNLKNFLFDLDGTLIDSVALIHASYRHTMEQHLDPVPPEEVWQATLGQPLWDTFAIFTDDRSMVDEMIATYRAHNIANHDAMVREYPGVRDAVETLDRRGKTLGIVTSKMRGMAQRGLATCGYDSIFRVIVGADDVERHKPHPEPVLKAMADLAIDPADTIYIGDSPHDMQSGRAAGVTTAAVLWGPFDRDQLEDTKPDHWIEYPRDLLLL